MHFWGFLTFIPIARLFRHMARAHPVALDVILGDKYAGFRPERRRPDFSMHAIERLQHAFFDPRLFPVHVLADDFVVKMIKRVRRNVFVELFAQFGFNVLK